MARPSICVVGTGYVGMATMIGLAQLGYGVRGYDILGDRIERLQRGIPPYREAGIEALLREHLAAGRLSFFAELADAACDAELIVIAVGTPTRDDGSADLSGLHDAIEQLVAVPFEGWPTVAVRSTVPPGTCDRLATVVEEFGELIYAPEFLREGSAVADFLSPDRIVVGARSPAAAVPYVRLFETLEK
ncbi:MAG: hypothetical protein ACREEA_09765, partial [Stellaceae bacterium]